MAKRSHKRVTYNPSLGRILARGARRSRTGRFHVISSISDKSKWSLVSEGSTKPIRVFRTQNAAISFAKSSELGSNTGQIIIHRRDGRIQNKISFQPKY